MDAVTRQPASGCCVTPPIRSRRSRRATTSRSYTHPLPAGTFNRRVRVCEARATVDVRITCSYDAPDVPVGGARLQANDDVSAGSSELIVDEEFAPHDPRSTARLESISGFRLRARRQHLTIRQMATRWRSCTAQRLTVLRWRRDDVARVDVRQDARRGARDADFYAPIRRAAPWPPDTLANAAEAHRLLDANQP